MTNREIRSWYLREIAKITEIDRESQARGDSINARARQAWRQRRELRLRARDMMEDPTDVERLRARDLKIYGSADGPTFQALLEKARSNGLGDAEAYQAILRSALSTDESVNKFFGL